MVVRQLVRRLAHNMFMRDNHLWWKKNLVKHQIVSKYYENEYLQNYILLFMSLLTIKSIKNSHIKARIYFTFLKNILKQICNALNTKL